MKDNTIILIDSTLREGAQAFGFTPSPIVKIDIARHVDRLGCDLIELGYPGAADEIAETARAITRLNLRAETLSHSLLREEEIDLAHNIRSDWIGFFLSINPAVTQIKYGKKYTAYRRKIADCVRYAHSLGLKVRFTCEDASRTDLELLIPFYQELTACGVNLIGYADTTGCLYPFQSRSIFHTIRKCFPTARLHFHGHKDRGLALANAVEAIQAGWDSVDASVLGLGERGGITPLTECAIALEETSGRRFTLSECKYLDNLAWDNLHLDRYHQRRFAHKAGLHCLSAIENPETYESLPMERMGEQRIGVLSKISGARSIMALAKAIGIILTRVEARALVQRIKREEREIWRTNEVEEFILSETR